MVQIDKVSPQDLVKIAVEQLAKSYSPYSHYPVSAALMTSTGKIYTGVNIENAAYPVTICAERVAVFKAVSEGELKFKALAVVTENGGSPCGSCRQVLSEFGLDTKVYIANKQGEIVMETTVGGLLPGAFLSEKLPG
jgi:cytidine deaminase